jgi:hypothetical protein
MSTDPNPSTGGLSRWSSKDRGKGKVSRSKGLAGLRVLGIPGLWNYKWIVSKTRVTAELHWRSIGAAKEHGPKRPNRVWKLDVNYLRRLGALYKTLDSRLGDMNVTYHAPLQSVNIWADYTWLHFFLRLACLASQSTFRPCPWKPYLDLTPARALYIRERQFYKLLLFRFNTSCSSVFMRQ